MSAGNVVLFPFMAHGHMNPLFDLARLLHARYPSLTLTFVTTSGYLPHFRRRLSLFFPSSSDFDTSLRVAALPFCPSDHSLPPDAYTSFALPEHLVTRFNQATSSLLPSFRNLLVELSGAGSPPLVCVIADMFLGWTVNASEDVGVFHAVLYPSGPYAMSIYNSIWTHLPHVKDGGADGGDDDDVIAIPETDGLTLRRRQLTPNMRSATSPDHQTATFVRQQAEFCRRSRATLWNTAEVLERGFLQAWASSKDQRVFAVGPLFAALPPPLRQLAISPGAGEDDEGAAAAYTAASECLAWLGRQKPGSVVYVSFGSQHRLPPAEATDLASALEAQERPYLWAAPAADQAPAEPAGFGLVVRSWVPQREVLRHPAVGAFVSHGGWNSVLESLRFGVPLVVRPIGGEQFINAKLLEEQLGAAVDVRTATETAEAVAEIIGAGEKGTAIRRRAQEIAAGLAEAVAEGVGDGGKGPSLRALDEFVELVLSS